MPRLSEAMGAGRDPRRALPTVPKEDGMTDATGTRAAIMDVLWLLLPPGRPRWPVNLERIADLIMEKLEGETWHG